MNTCTYIHIHNTYTALKGQAPSSRSAGVGVSGCDNSPGVHHCGGGPGKSNSHPSPQQRIPDECGRGRMMHVTVNVCISHCASYALHDVFSVPAPISTPRSRKLSLSTSHTSAAPQPGVFSWVSCMATRWYCRLLPLFLPLQLAR